MKQILTLAIVAGISTVSITTGAHAAQNCCAAALCEDRQYAAATSTQLNTSLPASDRATQPNPGSAATTNAQVQEKKLEVTSSYNPSVVTVEKGKPVVLNVHRKDAKNCGGVLLIPEFNVQAKIPAGETSQVKFTPTEAGTFEFTCGMKMMKGKIVVK